MTNSTKSRHFDDAYLLATSTANAPYRYQQSHVLEMAKKYMAPTFQPDDPHWDVFTNTRIDTRYFAVTEDWFFNNPEFGERNDTFINASIPMMESAINKIVERSGYELDQVSHLLVVTTTGLATPSLDARIMNRMPFNANLVRYPIWGLGCAGGSGGLSRAAEIANSDPDNLVLVVCVELCSLTFVGRDQTLKNMVATSLFADGCAAVLVGGKNHQQKSLGRLAHNHIHLWPDSEDVMGWEINEQGFYILMRPYIPQIVGKKIPEQYQAMHKLWDVPSNQNLNPILHPAGPKVLKAYETVFELDESGFATEWDCLRDYGNMSSPSVIYVLDEKLQTGRQLAEHNIIMGLGPGFSLEAVHFVR